MIDAGISINIADISAGVLSADYDKRYCQGKCEGVSGWSIKYNLIIGFPRATNIIEL